MKPIAGHSSTKFIRYYLFKNDRAIARDFVNLPEFDYAGHPWDKAMDLTRERRGTDKPAKEGDRVRTYEHIIVSLDQKDAGVDLDDFRDFVTEWAEAWFNDSQNGIGRFQAAIAYHDDNRSRLAQGETGILHAHLVINNVDLDSGRRISGLLTRKAVQSLRADLQKRALDYGWHAFATNGESLTAEEMEQKHVRVSRGRDLDRRAEAIEEVLGSDALDRDLTVEEMVRVDEALDAVVERKFYKVVPETIEPGQKNPNGQSDKDDKYAGFATTTIRFDDGRTMQMIIPKALATSQTSAEMAVKEREGWSWKDDIKDRVDLAKRVAQSPEAFSKNLSDMGVTVNYNRQGDLVYHHASDPDARKVKGSTLGHGYSASDITQTLAMKAAERIKRAHAAKTGPARWLEPAERRAAVAIAKTARPGTREGAERIAAIQSALDRPGKITGLADRLGITVPAAEPTPRRKLTEQEKLEILVDVRAARGMGGLAASGSSTPPQHRGPQNMAQGDGGRTPQRGR